jgi:peptide-methionine (S)-S-oxide reductase
MTDSQTELAVGRTLPPWHLVPIGPGEGPVPGPTDFQGRPLLVLFFSLRCLGCTARAVPFSNRVVVERGDEVQVVGILTDDPEQVPDDEAHEAFERLYVRFPVFRDTGLAATAHLYGTGGTPHWVLVGPSGTVRDSRFGSEPDRALLRLGYGLDELAGQQVVGFGGGCHWCTEAVFQGLRGVEKVEQGWIRSDAPADAESEAVVVHFDPDVIGLRTLVEVHLLTHASTAKHSMREKYRSAVYTFSDEQREEAEQLLATLSEQDDADYVTEALPFRRFRLNTQDYLDYYRTRPDAPFCRTYIEPKLAKIRERFARHARPLVPSEEAPPEPTAEPDVLTWREVIRRVNHGNPPPPSRVEKSDAEWKALLPEAVYRVTRQRGTERRYSSDLCGRFEPGTYRCRCCGTELFDTAQKVGGSGWPVFLQPAEDRHVGYRKDEGGRVEATCAVCDAHLGHVTPDGPAPGGLRYCINGLALEARD